MKFIVNPELLKNQKKASEKKAAVPKQTAAPEKAAAPKKAAVKKKAARKKRASRAAPPARLRAYWAVCDSMMRVVSLFPYGDKEAAEQKAAKLTKKQNNIITDIKIANRKMVEIIKDVRELNKNVTLAMNLDNKHLQNEYNLFRKKVTKVLRSI